MDTFTQSPACPVPLLNQESYHDHTSVKDATFIIDAAKANMLPHVRHRLTDRERRAIRAGSVFCFSEQESRIKRWTDGKQ